MANWSSCRGTGRPATLLLLGCLAGSIGAGAGSNCTVPGSHATLQSAVLDAGCAVVDVAAGVYDEALVVTANVEIAGPPGGGATITGGMRVAPPASLVLLRDLALDSTGAPAAGCAPRALDVRGLARVAASNVRVKSVGAGSCLFVDSFESGSTARWSATQP